MARKTEELGFDYRQEKEIFLSSTCRPGMVPTHTPTKWVPVAPAPGVKSPKREAEQQSATNAAEVMNTQSYIKHSQHLQGRVYLRSGAILLYISDSGLLLCYNYFTAKMQGKVLPVLN
jgi:hypothetical protein